MRVLRHTSFSSNLSLQPHVPLKNPSRETTTTPHNSLRHERTSRKYGQNGAKTQNYERNQKNLLEPGVRWKKNQNKQKEDQSTCYHHDPEIESCVLRLPWHGSSNPNDPKTEASPIADWSLAPVRKRDDSLSITRKVIFPYKMNAENRSK